VLPALDRLLFAGVVPAKDRDELADAYLFLRRAEHRVQMLDGAQTHRLPPPGERRWLARSMGYATEAAFEAALAAHRERVARLFDGLLGAGTGAVPLDPDLALLADPEVEPGRRAEIAARRGLVDPDRVLAAIDAMARRRTPFSPLGDPAAAVALLSDALGTPDPDQAISHLSASPLAAAASAEAVAAADLIDRARGLLSDGRAADAERVAAKAIEIAPASDAARAILSEAEHALGVRLRAELVEAQRRPRLRMAPAEVARLKLPSADRYLLSRCDGRRDVKALAQIAPLRERAVLPALDRLLFAGVVPARDRDELADAYLFLRRAEHRVQMVEGAQTHRLPPPGERLGLARSMGYASEAAFELALAAHRARVARLFDGLLGTGTGAVPLDPELALLADPQVERARRAAAGSRRRTGRRPRGGSTRPGRRSARTPRAAGRRRPARAARRR